MNTDTSKINAQYQTLLVIWFALVVSQLLFVLLIFFIKPELFHPDPAKTLLGSQPILVIALAAASFAALVLSFFMEKRLLDQSVEQQGVALVQQALIVGCSLCEAISLFGVLLAFSANYSYFFLFSGLGILGTILHFPSRKNLLAASYKL